MTASEFDHLHALVREDPEQAWPLVLAFAGIPANGGDAVDLLEDFVYEHDEAFIERLEAEALRDPRFADLIEQAHVGGFATVGAERFHALQERLRSMREG